MQRRAIGHSLSHTPPTPSSSPPPPPSPSSSMLSTKELTSSSPCSISSSPWVPAMNLKSAVIYSSNERASGELLHLSSNEFPPTTFFIDVTFWCHYPYIHYLSLSEPKFITNVQEWQWSPCFSRIGCVTLETVYLSDQSAQCNDSRTYQTYLIFNVFPHFQFSLYYVPFQTLPTGEWYWSSLAIRA